MRERKLYTDVELSTDVYIYTLIRKTEKSLKRETRDQYLWQIKIQRPWTKYKQIEPNNASIYIDIYHFSDKYKYKDPGQSKQEAKSWDRVHFWGILCLPENVVS